MTNMPYVCLYMCVCVHGYVYKQTHMYTRMQKPEISVRCLSQQGVREKDGSHEEDESFKGSLPSELLLQARSNLLITFQLWIKW